MTGLTRNDFAQPVGVKVEQVPLGNSYVTVRELTAQELIAMQRKQGDKGSLDDFGFVNNLLACCVIDDNLKPLFTDADDVASNFNVGLSVLRDLGERIVRLSGLDLKDEPEKN